VHKSKDCVEKLARQGAARNITIQIARSALFFAVLGGNGNQSFAHSPTPEFFNSIQGFSHGIAVKTGRALPAAASCKF
jgi:hypothetical protein